jgi:quinol monooxygenase YgiN
VRRGSYAAAMLIVTGSVQARPDRLDEVLALSLEHVHRSRLEPGCLLHSVHQDVEDPQRLVFVEHWQDRGALAAHFAVPASGAFVTALTDLTVGNPRLDIYDATAVSL